MQAIKLMLFIIAVAFFTSTLFAQGVKPPRVQFKEAYRFVQEGDVLEFPVVLDKTSNSKITVKYADYADWGSARDSDSCGDRPRTGGENYNPDYEEPGVSSRNYKILIFHAGVREQKIRVRTCEDRRVEPNETVVMRLISADGATIRVGGYGYDYSRGTILNDD